MGLTQIDLIKQIYYFFCDFRDFRESLFHIAVGAGRIEYARKLYVAMTCEACEAEPSGEAYSPG